jgi:hypothetical protein
MSLRRSTRSVNDYTKIEKFNMARKLVDLTSKYGLSSEGIKDKIEEIRTMFNEISGRSSSKLSIIRGKLGGKQC